jgi:NAD+ synthase
MIKKIPDLIKHITKELTSFTDLAVVGMSGGADSTLVSIICAQALGKDRVHTAHMPAVPFDHHTFNKLSWETAEKLGVHKYLIPIHDITSAFTNTFKETLKKDLSPLNSGNCRARIRMTTLYTLSRHIEETQNKRVRVIGTGNLSEDFIGYDTKGGDALADIFPIGQLYKSEVYQLLEYFRDQGIIDESMINRIPSAGLWEGQTDEKELGYSYNDMEKSIRKILHGQLNPSQAQGLDRFVYDRHLAHKHKHEASLVISARNFCD